MRRLFMSKYTESKQVSTDWKWTFSDYPESNGLKVFSCFSCGGGSTMGYKLAGCEVLGNVEIDPKMNELYVKNHHPKYNYCMDIREFNALPNNELPPELFNLDILDGSPPCTTFSMAGEREKSWGRLKQFSEGGVMQTLDDLPFVFCETVNKLKPKTVIIENVKGLILGNAYKYYTKILSMLDKYGYDARGYLLNGATMGVPQRRERVFIIGVRKSLGFDFTKLNLEFNYEPIPYKEVKAGTIRTLTPGTTFDLVARQSLPEEKSIADTRKRLGIKPSAFQTLYIKSNEVLPTLRAGNADWLDRDDWGWASAETIRNSQTFPQDYDFGRFTPSNVCYVCGMSVPPIMTKRIITRLIESDVFNLRNDNVK